MPKEIITLSFGSYASFVSAHFWNFQDEAAGYCGREGWSEYAASVDHDVLFAEAAESRNGVVSYRPRAVFFDIVGSSGGVSFNPDDSSLASTSFSGPSLPTWTGRCEVHRSAPVARSAFLETLREHEELDWDTLGDDEAGQQQAALEAAASRLDGEAGPTGGGGGGGGGGDARHWTDFCKVLFPPRSICLLPGTWAGPYDHSLASGLGAAADLVGARGGGGGHSAVVEDGVDRIRLQAEACDGLAGFQILTDDLTGFGALTAGVLGEVAEEFSGRQRIVFSLRRPGTGGGPQAGGGPVSTGMTTALARDELSQALALTHMHELASLYVPLAAPADRTSLPYLSYSPSRPFHTSALLAAAVDTALLPARMSAARSPLGEPLGASDLHSLVRLLRPGGPSGPNLAALHLALPCPSLPADLQQLQRQLDDRLRPPHESHVVATTTATPASGAGGREGGGGVAERGEALYGSTVQLALSDLANLTPGISGRDDVPGAGGSGGGGASRAESYCLRGGRTDAGPASTGSVLQALDLQLLRQPHRMCVRHRSAAPMPLALPLPFPNIFSPVVLTHGDVLAGASGPAAASGGAPGNPSGAGAAAAAGTASTAGVATRGSAGVHAGSALRPAGQAVHSVPVLTRLQATSEFEGWVRGVRDRWARAAGGTAGRAVLDSWGMGRDEVEEVGAQLREMAAWFEVDEH